MFSRKSCHLRDHVHKFGRAREVKDDKIVRWKPFACWVAKATGYVIVIVFPHKEWLGERASVLH
jgi:hypothetical protein